MPLVHCFGIKTHNKRNTSPKRSTMKYAIISVVITGATLVFSPASAMMMSCSGDMSKMTTMMSAMADGPHKFQMYTHLARINAAMSKSGVRGCTMEMKRMMGGSRMPMMSMGSGM